MPETRYDPAREVTFRRPLRALPHWRPLLLEGLDALLASSLMKTPAEKLISFSSASLSDRKVLSDPWRFTGYR
jgi:hypothetical protein